MSNNPFEGIGNLKELELPRFKTTKVGRKYIYKDDIKKLWKKQNGKCARRHEQLDTFHWHIDHIIPIALGGETDLSNLQILCTKCHMDKTAEDRKKIALAKKKQKSKTRNPFGISIPKIGFRI
jgi:5-methylcytosine-specific restriction endonuclease McrA